MIIWLVERVSERVKHSYCVGTDVQMDDTAGPGPRRCRDTCRLMGQPGAVKDKLETGSGVSTE